MGFKTFKVESELTKLYQVLDFISFCASCNYFYKWLYFCHKKTDGNVNIYEEKEKIAKMIRNYILTDP